jgi:regulator of sigma E protease
VAGRARPPALPGANLGAFAAVKLGKVPTCADGKPSFALADPEVSTFVAAVAPDSPAARAGIVRGDAITAVNGKPVHTWLDVNAIGRDLAPGVGVAVTLANGRTVQLLAENQTSVDDLTKEKVERVFLGFVASRRAEVDPAALRTEEVELARGLVEIGGDAWHDLVRVVRLNVLGIGKILTGQISFKTVGGPLMIMEMATDAAQEGWGTFLSLMALISVNLALMNLLPIPVLDGGHIAQAALEGITRRPLSARAREIANVVGLILLVTLMLFVFKNDIMRRMG